MAATETSAAQRPQRAVIIAVCVFAVLIVGGAAGWFFFGRTKAVPIALRLCGSNVLGSTLGFDLVQGYFSRAGGTKIEVTPFDAGGEATVGADVGGSVSRIAIRADGSGQAFAQIAAGTCDVAIVDREPTSDELATMHNRYAAATGGLMRSLAIDGVAVIVNPASGIDHLTIAQVRTIFGGAATNWSAFGRPSGTIGVLAPPDGSDIANILIADVLDGNTITASAHRAGSALALSSAVARDRDAIGIVALSDAGGAKAIALDGGAGAVAPSVATIGSTYPLTIKIGLYAPVRGGTTIASRFADYLAGDDAKNVIGNAGLVPAGP